MADGRCRACGGSANGDSSQEETAFERAWCEASRMYIWRCNSCRQYFHLDEKFPTRTDRHCTHCGSTAILNYGIDFD